MKAKFEIIKIIKCIHNSINPYHFEALPAGSLQSHHGHCFLYNHKFPNPGIEEDMTQRMLCN